MCHCISFIPKSMQALLNCGQIIQYSSAKAKAISSSFNMVSSVSPTIVPLSLDPCDNKSFDHKKIKSCNMTSMEGNSRVISCNGSSNSPIASSSGFPLPTPSNSSHLSNSSWVDPNSLSVDNSYHSNSAAELLPPLGVNNLSGFHSSYSKAFPLGLFSDIPSSLEQFLHFPPVSSPALGSEYSTGVSNPFVDDFLHPTSH